MGRNAKGFTIVFKREIDEEEKAKMRARGGIEVHIHGADGSRYNATFITPEHAAQDMARLQEKGFPCLADINLIIVPEITVEALDHAVEFLWQEGFFRRYATPYRPTLKRIVAMMSDYILFFRE